MAVPREHLHPNTCLYPCGSEPIFKASGADDSPIRMAPQATKNYKTFTPTDQHGLGVVKLWWNLVYKHLIEAFSALTRQPNARNFRCHPYTTNSIPLTGLKGRLSHRTFKEVAPSARMRTGFCNRTINAEAPIQHHSCTSAYIVPPVVTTVDPRNSDTQHTQTQRERIRPLGFLCGVSHS